MGETHSIEAQERQRAELALEITNTGVWDWDIVNNIMSWNATNYTLLGYQLGQDEPSYELWRCRLHPDEVIEVEQKMSQALANHSECELEYRVIWEDATIHWLLGKGKGIYDENGQAIRMIGTTSEITECKIIQLNQQFLNDLYFRLRQLNDPDQMLYLRKPLSGYGQFLLKLNKSN